MSIEEIYQFFLSGNGISTDTRNLVSNSMFFALKGANFNGNEFAEQAIENGCNYAIVDEADHATNEKCILVEDVLKALQNLANFHRKQFDIPVLGITGSNGKTTTKELIGAVLSKKYNLLITEGNLNNHLGVPFTLLRLTKEHEIAVIEMGANHPGEIGELSEIADPTHGIITNIGAAHIEGFGSLDGVIQTKKALYDYIKQNGGVLFYNGGDEILTSHLPINTQNISYGENSADLVGDLLGQTPFVKFQWRTEQYNSPVLETQLVGKYNFINFLAAACIGKFFDVEPELINEALVNYTPSNNRSQVSKTQRNTLIVDCYNANATSMKAAIESFAEVDSDNKLAILGDMLELGDISIEEHQEIVDLLDKEGIETILVGAEFQKSKSKFKKYINTDEVIKDVDLDSLSNTLILLKGSRGIRLEKLIPFL